MPGYSRTPRRYSAAQPGQRGFKTGSRYGSPYGPQQGRYKPGAKKRRKGKGKASSHPRRSRDFLEGQLYERDRMDGYRRPDDYTEEANYSSRSGPLRIGYRV